MPIPILSVAGIRAAEAEANRSGVSYDEMMQRAGHAIAARLADLLHTSSRDSQEWSVTFLIGPGNNGGDGLVAGRILASGSGALVRFYLSRPRASDDPHLKAVREAGHDIASSSDDPGFQLLHQMVRSSSIVVDALYGIGARLPLDDSARALLNAVRKALDEEASDTLPFVLADQFSRRFRPQVFAVDCPSGLDCDTGVMDDATLAADETMTMIAAKPGLLTFPGAAAVGRLAVANLGVPDTLDPLKDARMHLFTADDAAVMLPPRRPESHKGTFGRVLIVGGSANYPGAPALSARAACRSGAGLVTVATPGPLVEWLSGAIPECTWVHLPHNIGAINADSAPIVRGALASVQAMVLGMGLGRDSETREFLLRLLRPAQYAARSAIGFSPSDTPLAVADAPALPPLILDADGLSLLAEFADWPRWLPPGSILTPHPGEMARLCGLTAQEVVEQRWALAREKAAEWQTVLVLKGAHTLIANPNGDLRVLPFKSSALATAGTGDVLAGMIGALRAQGLTAFDAASAAAWWHGAAGMVAAERMGTTRGVTASDVIAAIPGVFAFGER
jgi:NAD(P)H-hydrate epimerase